MKSLVFFALVIAGASTLNVDAAKKHGRVKINTGLIKPQKYSVALVALGCPKNTVDAEVMLGDLQRSGLRVVREPRDADIVVVNTCAFVEDAKSECWYRAAAAACGHLRSPPAVDLLRSPTVTLCGHLKSLRVSETLGSFALVSLHRNEDKAERVSLPPPARPPPARRARS